MRVIITGDLHYGLFKKGDYSTHSMINTIKSLNPDVIGLCGDTFAENIDLLNKCLGLFDDFHGVKLLIAGNHDIWASYRYDSLTLYNEIIPAVADHHNFHYLDESPLIYNNTGFVGSIAWYDYSFRRMDLEIPMQAYREKSYNGFTWYDVMKIRWDLDDPAFTEYQYLKLNDHLAKISCNVDRIIVMTNHVPFRNMLAVKNDADWDFGNAFQGSEIFGHLLQQYKKVNYLVCGHAHLTGEYQNAHIKCYYIGSDYIKKGYVMLEIDNSA